ncbi:hypothetical protein FHS16_003715 [Paenibacillus endophyticus]|uniref:Uncharacterized protein n=1 Tax=Paenibacillus endophyticus TaxID=1294268 RepID=A0A7W5GBB4_9BACL|nr:hypothetical protein [Paenibacillus endophyticus]MBB3153640.1 hypothetical protein [Paenibacillus endophyticus]
MMRKKQMNYTRKPMRRNVSLFLLILLTITMAGCVPAPNTMIPIADIAVTGGHLIVQNETGFVWFDAKITIDDQYTYIADLMPAGKSSVPLSEFVDDQGKAYNRGRLSIRDLKIDITDTLGGKRHFDW